MQSSFSLSAQLYNFHFLSAPSSLSTSQFPFSSPLGLPDPLPAFTFRLYFLFPFLLPFPASPFLLPPFLLPFPTTSSNFFFLLWIPTAKHIFQFPPFQVSGPGFPLLLPISDTNVLQICGDNTDLTTFALYF